MKQKFINGGVITTRSPSPRSDETSKIPTTILNDQRCPFSSFCVSGNANLQVLLKKVMPGRWPLYCTVAAEIAVRICDGASAPRNTQICLENLLRLTRRGLREAGKRTIVMSLMRACAHCHTRTVSHTHGQIKPCVCDW